MTNKIDISLQKAQSECSRTGLRLTDKRCKVLKILLQAAEPLSAYDIVDQFKQVFAESLSAMSAYRMLDFLMQANLVHKLETSNQYLACSHISCEHNHELPQFLICDQCHTVKEIGLSKQLLKELRGSIESTGFVLSSQQLELHGVCEACRAKQSE
ncbi:MAG: transcriptional repressor [Methylococcales bacterium]|nr:transcriptional repressor [Methylococcales bacterium]